MEFLYFSFPLLSTSFCLIFCLSYMFYYKTKTKSDPLLPPGRSGWPIIGETIAYGKALRSGKHEKFFQARIEKYSSKVFRTSLFGEPFVVLLGAVGNKFMFSKENKLVQSWYPKSIDMILSSVTGTSSTYETLIKERKLILRCLNSQALQSFTGIIDTEARKHFKTHWDNKEEVHVVSLARDYMFTVAYRLFLNRTDDVSLSKDIAEMIKLITSGLHSLSIYIPGGKLSRGINAAKLLKARLLTIIKQRKIDLFENNAPQMEDLLSNMLLARDENNKLVDEDGVAIQIFGLLLASGESTSSSISFVLKYLAENPHIYDKVLEEQMDIAKSKEPGELLNWNDLQKMKYLWNVICETLRITSTSFGGFRNATTSINYEGFSIPKGWKLHWSANYTHMNSDYFPEPEKFDPSRFEGDGPAPYTYVPFGGGPRMCPGKEFARIVMLTFIHHAVIKYRWEKVFPDEQTITNGVPFPAKGLPIRLRQHS